MHCTEFCLFSSFFFLSLFECCTMERRATEKTRGNPLNTYARGTRRDRTSSSALLIITYRIYKRAFSNFQNISFVRTFVYSFSFFLSICFLLFGVYIHEDWHTRHSITHSSSSSSQETTRRYPMQS